MQVDDLSIPTPHGAVQFGQFWWTARVGEVVGEFSEVGAGYLRGVDVVKVALSLLGVPRQTHLAFRVSGSKQAPHFRNGVFNEAFTRRIRPQTRKALLTRGCISGRR